MKTPTITIPRAEYDQLNKAANAAVEHACELFWASRLVDELKARVAELENLYQKRGEAYEEERKEHEAALEVEEKRRWALEDVINELFERIEELEAERDALEARIVELEAGRDELVVEASRFAADNNELRDDADRLAVERDGWFSAYQNLKERTNNYDFLLSKTKEQEKEIYRLVKEINKLGG